MNFSKRIYIIRSLIYAMTSIAVYNTKNQITNVYVTQNRNDNAIMFGLILVALALFLVSMS